MAGSIFFPVLTIYNISINNNNRNQNFKTVKRKGNCFFLSVRNMTFRVASTKIGNGIYLLMSNRETENTQGFKQDIVTNRYNRDWNNEGLACKK